MTFVEHMCRVLCERAGSCGPDTLVVSGVIERGPKPGISVAGSSPFPAWRVFEADVVEMLIVARDNPSEAMLAETYEGNILGGPGPGDECYSANPTDVWRAMLNGALEEVKQS